jgi:hypothetical protein
LQAVKYWKHIGLFGLYFAVLMICKMPDISQKCFGNDCFSFLYIASFLSTRYPSPLYAIFGYPVAHLPFGSDGGNLVLFLSVIPAFLTSILVFLILSRKTENKWAPFVGSAVYMGCYITFSQAIITEIYSLLAFLMALSYYLMVIGRYRLSAAVTGLILASHYMTGGIFFIVFLVWNKKYRKYFYLPIIIGALFWICYLFLFKNFYWDPNGGNAGFFSNLFRQIINAFGLGDFGSFGSGIWMAIQMAVISFGIAIIPILVYSKKIKESAPYVFMVFIPIIWIAIGAYRSRFVDLVPFVPFAAIMAGMGTVELNIKHFEKLVLICSIAMLISMPFVFLRVDERPTTARQIINELDTVPDDSLIMCVKLFPWEDGAFSDTCGGHIAAVVDYYNRKHGTSFIPVDVTVICDTTFTEARNRLIKCGVILPDTSDISFKDQSSASDTERWYMEQMEALAEANPERNVYYYKCTDIGKEKYEITLVTCEETI